MNRAHRRRAFRGRDARRRRRARSEPADAQAGTFRVNRAQGPLFEPDGDEIEVPVGTPHPRRRRARRRARVGYACGGVCACSTCHVYVKQGLELAAGGRPTRRTTSWTRRSTCARSRASAARRRSATPTSSSRSPREPSGVARRAPRHPRRAEGRSGRRLALAPCRGSTSSWRATSAGHGRLRATPVADGRVQVAGAIASDPRQEIATTNLPVAAAVDEEPISLFDSARVLLNKPIGCVTALRDPRHPTAYELLARRAAPRRAAAGGTARPRHLGSPALEHRRRRRSSGSRTRSAPCRGPTRRRWRGRSRRCPRPGPRRRARPPSTRSARWRATTAHPSLRYPARRPRLAAITIVGGAYHEVRRIFAALGSHVLGLCRVRFGDIELPRDLAPGDYQLAAETTPR